MSTPYDLPNLPDIMDSLPDWVPEQTRFDFQKRRARWLRENPQGSLCDAIEQCIEVFQDDFASTEYRLYESKLVGADHDVAILARILIAVRLGLDEGLALLTDKEHAGRVKKGDDYGDHQANIASNPRGKIGDGGETNNQIIGQLALASEYEELSAKELWTHYFSVLNDDLQRNPKESEAADDWRKIVIEYDFKDGRKKITGGQFAKVVSDYRTGKKLP